MAHRNWIYHPRNILNTKLPAVFSVFDFKNLFIAFCLGLFAATASHVCMCIVQCQSKHETNRAQHMSIVLIFHRSMYSVHRRTDTVSLALIMREKRTNSLSVLSSNYKKYLHIVYSINLKWCLVASDIRFESIPAEISRPIRRRLH